MKYVLIATVLISGNALAMTTMDSLIHTCAQLQSAVAREKVVFVKYGILNLGKTRVWDQQGDAECTESERVEVGAFKMKDGYCEAGYRCL